MRTTKYRYKITIATATLALFALACASTSVDRKIDSKLVTEPRIADTKALGGELKALIDQSDKSSSSQKNRLLTLQGETREQLAQLREQSLKLRSILIKDVIQTQYNPDEITKVKERLKKTEDRRLVVIFAAIDNASSIIGNVLPESEMMLRSFYESRY